MILAGLGTLAQPATACQYRTFTTMGMGMSQVDRVEPFFHNGEAPPPAAIVRHRPAFTGNATEFFGIWIVNLVLSVLTLGIYSAWAKVRTQRYFYANTRLVDAPFEYLADPIAILKGRLIAYAVVITLAVGFKLQAFWLVIPLYLLVFAALPFLVCMGLRFRARYSAWRGLRFRFDGTVGEAYTAYLWLPIASLFTLNLLLPYVVCRQHAYMMGNHAYGRKRFSYSGEAGSYYTPFLISLGMAIGLFVLMLSLLTAGIASGTEGMGAKGMGLAVVGLVYGGMFAIGVYLRARWLNLMWNNTRMGEHRIECRVQARRLAWIYLSNGVVILCTLGLAVPWAMVRTLRYRLECIELLVQGTIDEIQADGSRDTTSTGAEMVDALDMDMDIAL